MIQTFFEAARLEIEIQDRFGKSVNPREWFIVPLSAIDEAVEKIKNKTIGQFKYDVESARLIEH